MKMALPPYTDNIHINAKDQKLLAQAILDNLPNDFLEN